MFSQPTSIMWAFISCIALIILCIASIASAVIIAKLFIFVKRWEVHLFIFINSVMTGLACHVAWFLWPGVVEVWHLASAGGL